MLKKIIVIIVSLLLSIAIAVFLPTIGKPSAEIEQVDGGSLIEQSIIDYSEDRITNYKVYDSGKLVGVVSDKDYFYSLISSYEVDVDFEYDKQSIGLTENIYCVDELSNLVYENADDEIFNYLIQNKCLGIETACVELSNEQGVFDKIYVLNEEDFTEAENQFILNFISEDTLKDILQEKTIESPNVYGSVEKGISILETVNIRRTYAPLDEIYGDVNKIYEYLCYGRNTERQYYTTKAGDTLAGVGYNFNNMSAKQIMMLNPDIIKDENQIIEEGTVLNVAYYDSPLTVVVTKERLAREVIFPESVIYTEDASLPAGTYKVKTEEENGLKNVLYKEYWINGVRQDDKDGKYKPVEMSSIEISKAIQGEVLVGKGVVPSMINTGSGNWRYPVANPLITCDYTCYANHGGVDFYNLYNPWDFVYAIDAGVVTDTGWTDIGGYYARVDHGNGYSTYYGHFSAPAIVTAGQAVSAGDILGAIGMTGNATGPHVHLAMYYENSLINPCTVLNCDLLY